MICGSEVLPARPFKPDELREWFRSFPECEKIYLFDDAELAEVCAEFGFARKTFRPIVSIDLTKPVELLWQEMSAKRRNGIRYAQKHGVIARPATEDDVEGYTNVWVNGYCAKFGKSTDDAAKRASYVIRNTNSHSGLLLAQLGEAGPVIAGLEYRDAHSGGGQQRYIEPNTYSYYATNSSLPDYLKFKPNELLVWAAIQRAKEAGYREFVLGTAEAQFKREFSDRRAPVVEWIKPAPPA